MTAQRKQLFEANAMTATDSVIQVASVPETDQELMTTRDLMTFLNFSRTKIWALVQHEQLPAFKLGGDYRYRRSEVMQWLERYRVNQ
jgi:excisionase family DNA binding protein